MQETSRSERTVESILRERGVLDDSSEAVTLPPAIEEAVLDVEGTSLTSSRLAEDFDRIPSDSVLDDRDGEVFVLDGESVVAHWHSEAAALADIGATRVLDDRVHGWRDWDLQRRARALELVRGALTECPNCGGDVDVKTESKRESCDAKTLSSVICVNCRSPLLVTH